MAEQMQGRELATTERFRLRQAEARPLLADWHAWLLASHKCVPPTRKKPANSADGLSFSAIRRHRGSNAATRPLYFT
jgi:hypothetical protein